MSLRHGTVLAVALFATLGLPRAGHAGIADYIWEMSGPTMLGTGVECTFWSIKAGPYCTLADIRRISGDGDVHTQMFQRSTQVWGSLDITGYGSLGNEQTTQNGETIRFDRGHTWMVALDPMINVRWRLGKLRLHHGFGGAINFMVGDFRRFVNPRWKVRPLGFTFDIPRFPIEVSWDVRLYSDSFEGDPQRRNHLSKGEPSEVVKLGIAVSFPLTLIK